MERWAAALRRADALAASVSPPAEPVRDVAVVVGAGPGIGSAVVRKLHAAGFLVVCCRRTAGVVEVEPGGTVLPVVSCDARDPDAVERLFAAARARGRVRLVVHNIGANVGAVPVRETTPRLYRKVWEMAAFSAFLVGRAAAEALQAHGEGGSLIFTNATAATRGKAGFSAFAGACFAKRALAQSLARELGPQGIHVAHVVIDGPVDVPWVVENFPEALQRPKQPALVAPDDVARVYLQLHRQPRSAWSFEIDLRPWSEHW